MWKSIATRYKTKEMGAKLDMLKTTSVAVDGCGEAGDGQFSLFCFPQSQSNFHGKELLSTGLSTTSVEISDITAGKHGGNENSKAANERITPHKCNDREAIYLQIAAEGFHGMTLKEIRLWDARAERFRPVNEFSGRVTELHTGKYVVAPGAVKRVIYKSGRKREGSAVYVSEKRWVSGGAE